MPIAPVKRVLTAALLLLTFCACAALCLTFSPASAHAAKAKVRVTATTSKTVSFRVTGPRAAQCVVTVRRGSRKIITYWDMGVRGRADGRERIPGRKKPRLSVKCEPTRMINLDPHHAVRVDITMDGNFPEYVTVHNAGPIGKPATDIFGRYVEEAFDAWEFVDMSHPKRQSFNSNFSKILFEGKPRGVDAYHIGVLDLLTLRATDLTAARQGSGFSASVLCEKRPAFRVTYTPRVVFSDDQVTFESSTGNATGQLCGVQAPYMQTSLSAPTQMQPADDRAGYSYAGANGRGLDESSEERTLHFSDLPSSDGVFITDVDGEDSPRVRRAADDAVIPIACAAEWERPWLLGWTGPRTFVVEYSTGSSVSAGAITLAEDGNGTCQPLVPATDKSLQGFALSGDRRQLEFFASAPQGTELYRMTLGAAEPELTSGNALSFGADTSWFEVGPIR